MPLNIIASVVCDYYKTTPKKIFVKKRDRDLVEPRQVFFYLSKLYNKNLNLAYIGCYYKDLNGCFWDHAVVIHSMNVIKSLMETDRKFKDKIDTIKKRIGKKHLHSNKPFLDRKRLLMESIKRTNTNEEMYSVISKYLCLFN